MNRQQRRSLEKQVRQRGASKASAKDFVQLVDTKVQSPPKNIQDGWKVRLNIERIKARSNYDRMSDAYKQFVDESESVVFTAVRRDSKNLIGLAEDPRWLFWSGDLDTIEEHDEEVWTINDAETPEATE